MTIFDIALGAIVGIVILGAIEVVISMGLVAYFAFRYWLR